MVAQKRPHARLAPAYARTWDERDGWFYAPPYLRSWPYW
jgi:hypothetical protein